jgi:hypothetical protein
LTIFTIYLILKYIIYLNFLCSVSQRKTLWATFSYTNYDFGRMQILFNK